MRIALVVHDFDPRYGQGRYAVELCRRLAPRHAIDVYANTFAPGAAEGVGTVPVPAWRTRALTTVLSFLVNSERRLRRRRYDLIHAQGLTSWRADVITAHVCNAARLQRGGGRGRDALFSRIVVPLEVRFYRQRRARHLIAISRQVEREIRACYGWTRPSTVIHHGTDTLQFRPPADAAERAALRGRFGLRGESWAWLFVGEAVKGLAAVMDQLPAFGGAELLVISRSDLAPFKAQARRLGVAERVRFHGPESEISLPYRAADVFLYPSPYDTFGLVVAEAMASGRPVVVGREIGAAEWIEPGRNGLLCDPAAPETLRAALAWLQEHPREASLLGAAARATVERHDWDACAAATEAVYRAAADPGTDPA